MKLRLLFFGLAFLMVLTTQAQYKKYTFGLKAAPHLGWIKPNLDTYEGNGIKAGFSWGFISEIGFSENHCISTGFNVAFSGGNLKFPTRLDADPGTMQRTYYLKSIEIPLTLKMRTNAIGNLKYYGQIGLGTNFLLNAKKEDEFKPDNTSTTITTTKAAYDKVSFLRESLIIGLGCEYTLGAGTILSAGLALNNGFTDMLTDKNTLTQKKEKATASFVELNVAVLF